jgi:maltooligosyltrehalose trehalohydrolase
MTTFSVWAPFATTVDARGDDFTCRLERIGGGWFAGTLGDQDGTTSEPGADIAGRYPVSHGLDYAFVLDGGAELPDPRSRWQPAGVTGRSRTFDPGRFVWTDERFEAAPLEDAVIYELHVGTFTPDGTFRSAIDRLDRLVDLGVTHIELMPVAAFSGRHGWGYDGVFLFAPHPSYGAPHDLQALVDAAHGRGLAVILDVVYNHFGPEGNVLTQYGPYLTDRYRTPWGAAVNVDDAESDEVRRFFIDNACSWLRDFHIDGLRLDAVHAIVDNSALPFLEQLSDAVAEVSTTTGRPRVLIAEDDRNDPRSVRARPLGGYGLDAQWNDDFHHALHRVLTGERTGYYTDYPTLADLAVGLTQGYVYGGRYSTFRRRTQGRPATGVPGRAFVACMQNHDQIGNRPLGDRIGCVTSAARQRIGAALLLAAPFVPLLFQGEEWSASTPFPYFADHQDASLVAAVRKGRVDELVAAGWDPADVPDPEDAATFERAKLDWDECELTEHASMRAWYRGLIALRRAVGDLRDDNLDDVRAHADEDAGTLLIERGRHRVVCNLGAEDVVVAFDVEAVLAWSDRSGFGLGADEQTSPPAAPGGDPRRVAPDGVLIARVR